MVAALEARKEASTTKYPSGSPASWIERGKNHCLPLKPHSCLKEREEGAVGVLVEILVKDFLAKLEVALGAANEVVEDQVESEEDEGGQELAEVVLPFVSPQDLGEAGFLLGTRISLVCYLGQISV